MLRACSSIAELLLAPKLGIVTIFFCDHDGSDHNVGGDDYGEKYYDDGNPYLGLAIAFNWVQNAVSLQNSEELLLHFDLKI